MGEFLDGCHSRWSSGWEPQQTLALYTALLLKVLNADGKKCLVGVEKLALTAGQRRLKRNMGLFEFR